MRRISLLLVVLLFVVPLAYAAPSISMTDNWAANGGTTADEILFVGYKLYPQVTGITDFDADMLCYDWDDDGNYDNCYWDDNGCGGGGCNADSCNYFSEPAGMPSSWKTGCNIDGGPGRCVVGAHVPERICNTCDGVSTGKEQRTFIDAKLFYDCDDSNSNRHVTEVNPSNDFYVVRPQKYDCNNCIGCSTYDLEGDYQRGSGNQWIGITTRVCSSGVCSESADDINRLFGWDVLPNPCGTNDGASCSEPSDCSSNRCDGDVCSTCNSYECTDPVDQECIRNNRLDDTRQLFCQPGPGFDEFVECSAAIHESCEQRDIYSCTNQDGLGWKWRVCDVQGCANDECIVEVPQICLDNSVIGVEI
jgi:hypothetical protein